MHELFLLQYSFCCYIPSEGQCKVICGNVIIPRHKQVQVTIMTLADWHSCLSY